MRATITVYGEQGSGKTDWLSQLKRALLATAPVEAVNVTVHESQQRHGRVFVAEQFDEFTIPAADAVGTAGVAGDRETWSVVPTGTSYHVYCGTNRVAGFFKSEDAHLFMNLKSADDNRRGAVVKVLTAPAFLLKVFLSEEAALADRENCKGGGGEIAEGAGAIPPAVYWHEAAGNFISWWTDAPLSATFYKAWAARRAEFPQSRADCQMRRIVANSVFGKLSAAEAPAIHDAWPTPTVPKIKHDQLIEKYTAVSDKYSEAVDRIDELLSAHHAYRRDAVELREERDEARRERDDLRARFANVITYLNGCKNLGDALRDTAVLNGAS